MAKEVFSKDVEDNKKNGVECDPEEIAKPSNTAKDILPKSEDNNRSKTTNVMEAIQNCGYVLRRNRNYM